MSSGKVRRPDLDYAGRVGLQVWRMIGGFDLQALGFIYALEGLTVDWETLVEIQIAIRDTLAKPYGYLEPGEERQMIMEAKMLSFFAPRSKHDLH